MDKYQRALKYVNTKRKGSLPSEIKLYDKIQRLDFRSVATLETAILRCKAMRCDIPAIFNEIFCDKTTIHSVGMLEPKDYSKSGQAEFKKKVQLFKAIIVREGLHLFDVELDKKIYLEYMKDLGT